MKWLVPLGHVSGQRAVLVCIPYAGGGSAVFRDWKVLGDRFDVYSVRAPGKEARLAETPLDDVRALARGLYEELAPLWAKQPIVLFGHSLGAAIAFEVARLGRDAGRSLVCLVVSGHRAPHRARKDEPVAHLPRDEFLDELKTLGGTPPEFFEHDELVDLLLPALRADFAAAERYLGTPAPPLSCPLLAYTGADDDDPTPDEMRAWSEQTTATFRLRVFVGDHFYLHDTAALLSALREDLP